MVLSVFFLSGKLAFKFLLFIVIAIELLKKNPKTNHVYRQALNHYSCKEEKKILLD